MFSFHFCVDMLISILLIILALLMLVLVIPASNEVQGGAPTFNCLVDNMTSSLE